MHAHKSATQSVRLILVADTGEAPNMAEVALFLYDFDCLYEIARLAVDPQYRSLRFSRFSLYRNGRPLMTTDRMRMEAISLQSPLEVVATIAVVAGAAASVAAAIWAIVQVIEKLYDLPLSRQKLELEVRKLKREEAQARLPLGLPLLIHMGSRPDTGNVQALLDALPELKLILAHLGIPWFERSWAQAERYSKVYLDISGPYLSAGLVAKALKVVGPDKLIYGTDGPYGLRTVAGGLSYAPSKSWVEQLPIGQQDKDKIFSGNLMHLLG